MFERRCLREVIETIRLARYIKHGSEDEKIKKIDVTKKWLNKRKRFWWRLFEKLPLFSNRDMMIGK